MFGFELVVFPRVTTWVLSHEHAVRGAVRAWPPGAQFAGGSFPKSLSVPGPGPLLPLSHPSRWPLHPHPPPAGRASLTVPTKDPLEFKGSLIGPQNLFPPQSWGWSRGRWVERLSCPPWEEGPCLHSGHCHVHYSEPALSMGFPAPPLCEGHPDCVPRTAGTMLGAASARQGCGSS